MSIAIADWIRENKLKKREGYRILERMGIKPVKEKRKITQTREMWVLCIPDDVKPESQDTLAQ